MKPSALLILYEPNHQFKNKKYFLRQGINHFGSDSACQISIIDDKFPLKAGYFKIYNRLLTVASTSRDCLIEVPSNLEYKCKCLLQPGLEYVLMPQKDFKIGKWKGLFKGLAENDYQYIKNIENQKLFNTELEVTEKYESDQNLNNAQNDSKIIVSAFDSTLPIVQTEYQNTLLIQSQTSQNNMVRNPEKIPQQINLDFTLPIEEPYYQSTLILEQPEQKVITQKIQYQSSPMPQTLQEGDEVPEPDFSIYNRSQIKMNQQSYMTKTLPVSIYKNQNKPQVEFKKTQSEFPKIIKKDDFLDLFDEIIDQPDQKKQKQVIKQDTRMVRKLLITTSSSGVDSSSLNLNKQIKAQGKEKQDSGVKLEKKIAFSGFVPTEVQKIIARNMKLKIIESPSEDYDILIVGNQIQIKIRLLQALILGKQIYQESYINNGNGKIYKKIWGKTWDQIYANRGRRDLFNGKIFFLSQLLIDYRRIIELAGGTIQLTLSKGFSKLSINLIITNKDKDLYLHYKNYKNWKFYSESVIQESVCLGKWADHDQINAQYF